MIAIEVRHGDALAVLADLPSATVDALITDPPYSSGGFTRGDRIADPRRKYARGEHRHDPVTFAGDGRDQHAYGYWCSLWLTEALRVVKPGGVCLLFTDWRQLPVTTDALQAGGWVWRGIVPWHKVNARPQFGRFRASCEYVVWGSAGMMPVDDSAPCLPGFVEAIPPPGVMREHITEKPVSILRELVRIAPPGGLVLDPFCGTGSTGVAAVLEGRRFLGVEITEHFADLAERRVREAAQGYREPPGQLVFGADDAAEAATG